VPSSAASAAPRRDLVGGRGCQARRQESSANWRARLGITRNPTDAGTKAARTHEIDNLGKAISLVASTRGVTLLPAYARNFLPWSVTSRPLEGETPMIDLAIGYQKANRSPILKLFLSRIDDLIARVAHETRASSVVSVGRSTAAFSQAN
jgi:DNA-binding transcriptional LysR family regulator